MPKIMKTRKQPFTQVEFYVEVLPRKHTGCVKLVIVGTHEVIHVSGLNELIRRYPGIKYRVTARRFYDADGVYPSDGLPIL